MKYRVLFSMCDIREAEKIKHDNYHENFDSFVNIITDSKVDSWKVLYEALIDSLDDIEWMKTDISSIWEINIIWVWNEKIWLKQWYNYKVVWMWLISNIEIERTQIDWVDETIPYPFDFDEYKKYVYWNTDEEIRNKQLKHTCVTNIDLSE